MGTVTGRLRMSEPNMQFIRPPLSVDQRKVVAELRRLGWEVFESKKG